MQKKCKLQDYKNQYLCAKIEYNYKGGIYITDKNINLIFRSDFLLKYF